MPKTIPLQTPAAEAVPHAMSDFVARTMWEGLEFWKAGCDLWLQYLSALPGAALSPAALMDANTRFFANTLDASGFAAGALLKDAGLEAPVLSDA